MYCTKCGNRVSDKASFCEKCGTKLNQILIDPVPKNILMQPIKVGVPQRKLFLTSEGIRDIKDTRISYINAYTKVERKKKSTYVVIDFETTGIDMISDEIIEYAAVKVENGVVSKYIHSLCKPYYPIPIVATKINGISNQMVADKLNFVDHLDELINFIGDSVIVAHNASFDVGFLNKYCYILNRPLYTKCSCTMRMARATITNGIGNYKLITVAQYFKITNDDIHRALGDALATAKVFIEILKMSSASNS